MHAVILAGGFGTRLRSTVGDVPKPLAPVGGRPFLCWVLDALAAQGVTGVTLSVYHQWEKIRDYFDSQPMKLAIDYAVEPEPLGTGGAIAYALAKQQDNKPVIVMNGDTFMKFDYHALYKTHSASGAKLTLTLREMPDTARYGQVMVSDGIVTDFCSGSAGQAGLINAGVYVMKKDLFAPFSMPRVFSFEKDFLPPHLKALAPHAYLSQGYFIDIGIPEDYARADRELPILANKNQ